MPPNYGRDFMKREPDYSSDDGLSDEPDDNYAHYSSSSRKRSHRDKRARHYDSRQRERRRSDEHDHSGGDEWRDHDGFRMPRAAPRHRVHRARGGHRGAMTPVQAPQFANLPIDTKKLLDDNVSEEEYMQYVAQAALHFRRMLKGHESYVV